MPCPLTAALLQRRFNQSVLLAKGSGGPRAFGGADGFAADAADGGAVGLNQEAPPGNVRESLRHEPERPEAVAGGRSCLSTT